MEPNPQTAGAARPATSSTASAQDEPLVTETLVEEVSIDGMCGVY